MNSDITQPDSAISRHPTVVLGSLFILSAIFLLSYYEILSWVGKGWLRLNNAYSFVIFLLFLYMVWQKRDRLRRETIRPNIPAGTLVVISGCFVLVAGKLTATLLLQGISFVISLFGLVWLVFGNNYARRLWVPVGYLIFMFYLFEEVLGNFSLYFQQAAAWIAARLLSLGGMPVALEGHLIELPHISLEVAKVCNGINHMLALVAIAIPFAYVSTLPRVSKIAVVLAAAAVGVLANGLRVAMIGIWSKYNPDGPLHGPFDIFYVSFILIFGLLLFSLVKLATIKFGRRQPARFAPQPPSRSKTAHAPRRTILKAALIGMAIFGGTGVYLFWQNPRAVPLDYRLADFPMQIGPWQGSVVSESDWPIKHLSADNELKRLYRNPATGAVIGLYVGYFQDQHQDKELISDRLSWLHIREKRLTVQLDGEAIIVARGQPRGLADQTYEGDKRLFYFWYMVDGKPYIDRYAVKLKLLFENMLQNRSNAALVLVSVEKDSTTSMSSSQAPIHFISLVYPLIQNTLSLR